MVAPMKMWAMVLSLVPSVALVLVTGKYLPSSESKMTPCPVESLLAAQVTPPSCETAMRKRVRSLSVRFAGALPACAAVVSA